MDETNKQLLGEVRPPRPGYSCPGHPAYIDNEYRHFGTANLFLFCEPLRGWRQVKVTERRTKADWAVASRELVDVELSEAERIVLVMDNLNTHTPASLTRPSRRPKPSALAGQARHPSHPQAWRSWLNIAEIELSVLARRCLDRIGAASRLPTRSRPAAEADQNASQRGVDWRFSTADARVKLKRLYPSRLT